MPEVLIGKNETAIRGTFLKPERSVAFYFGREEKSPFGAGTCTIPPGSSNEMHAHDDADEIIYVIDGHMRMVVEGEDHHLRKGEAIVLFKGQQHQIFNESDVEELWHTFTFSPPDPADAIREGYGNSDNFRRIGG